MRAVCLSCGASKWGALTECRACGVKPATVEDQARSMLASEDALDSAGLDALAERVAAGQPVELDPSAVAQWMADLEKVPVAPLGWTLLVLGAPFVLLLGITLLAVALFSG